MSNDIVMAYARLPKTMKYDKCVKRISEMTGKTEKQVKTAVTRFINQELKAIGISL